MYEPPIAGGVSHAYASPPSSPQTIPLPHGSPLLPPAAFPPAAPALLRPGADAPSHAPAAPPLPVGPAPFLPPAVPSPAPPPAVGYAAAPFGSAPPVAGGPTKGHGAPHASPAPVAPRPPQQSAQQPAPKPVPLPAAVPPARTAKSAKFIAAETTATKFDLTADGKLPELVLADKDRAAATDAPAARTPPWFLIGMLGFSVISSVLMLVVDTAPVATSLTSHAAAREAIQLYYVGQPPRLEPYQARLRLALQAGGRGDRAEERRLYQEVLALLRSEGTSKFRGLTGMASNALDPPDGPPHDRHLERLISILLSDE